MKKFFLICAMAAVLLLVACGGTHAPSNIPAEVTGALSSYPTADIRGYASAASYTQPSNFVSMTVRDVVNEMDAGTPFVLFCAYNDCPWCNSIVVPLNDLASECGIKIGYIDTRANPSWQSNLDIDDYDLFVERFGSALETDDSGAPHLYVPHMFFVKDGQLVADHAGTVPSQDDSSTPLTDEQLEEFRSMFFTNLASIVQ